MDHPALTQANSKGPGQDDVPALLRRIAATLEQRGPVEVADLVLHSEITDDGDRPALTIDFHWPSPDQSVPTE